MVTFLQPRHIYAPQEGDGHIHLSAPLITAAARINAASYSEGIHVRDENFARYDRTEVLDGVVGINIVGAPYIPVIREILETRIALGSTVLLGGQIVDSLSEEEFDQLFKFRSDITVLNGNDDRNLISAFRVTDIPNQEEVSSVGVWNTLDEEMLKGYLTNEFSFYLSQGCKFNCKFCQAAKARPEKYRDLNLANQDLMWLAQRASDFGSQELQFYLSNLDIFQKPKKLIEFCKRVAMVSHQTGIEINFRGLSTTRSLSKAPVEALIFARRVGLQSIGFGLDGDESTWKANRKGHNKNLVPSAELIRIVRANDLTPEVLMVCGHPNDTKESLIAVLEDSRDMQDKYGAIIRAHLAKHIIPGAKGWKDPKNSELVKRLLSDPSLFQALDYCALASEVTHLDPAHRKLVNEFYRELCDLGPGSTKIIYPDTPEWRSYAAAQNTTIRKMNEGRFDR